VSFGPYFPRFSVRCLGAAAHYGHDPCDGVAGLHGGHLCGTWELSGQSDHQSGAQSQSLGFVQRRLLHWAWHYRRLDFPLRARGGVGPARIPLVSNVYDISKRFVAIMDRSGEEDSLKSMSPVWCFFGGEGSAGVLALMPSHEPVSIGETRYVPVLVPFAPVPFGGALIYVPQDWVRPAEGGVEKLVNVYVSMGVTPPEGLPPGGVPAGIFPTGTMPAGGIQAGRSAAASEGAAAEPVRGAPESAPTSAGKPAPRKRARKRPVKAMTAEDGEAG